MVRHAKSDQKWSVLFVHKSHATGRREEVRSRIIFRRSERATKAALREPRCRGVAGLARKGVAPSSPRFPRLARPRPVVLSVRLACEL